jgi:hypothetical protein
MEKQFMNECRMQSSEYRIMNESIYIWIIGGLLSLVNFLFWSRIKRIEKDVNETKKKSSSIEKNYLTRFEDLHKKLSDVEKNIIKEIYEVKLSVINNNSLKD